MIMIRLLLTSVLLYFVYQETGWATLLFGILMTGFAEISGYSFNILFKRDA